jgi:replicative DNA helicase
LPAVEPLVLPARELPVEPYALGVWLAGAGATLSPELQMLVEGGADSLTAVSRSAGSLGITRRGFIPPDYLRSGVAQRRALLAGLLDAAGEVADDVVVFRTESRPLAQSVYELLATLGISADVSGHPPSRPGGAAAVRLSFRSDAPVFQLPDKQLRHKESIAAGHHPEQRRITAITSIPSVPVRCIEVGNDSHLFLAGRSMVPTHNSTLGLDVARSAAIKHGLATVIFSLEMSRNEIVMRLLSAEAQIPLHHMRSGKMHDPEWRKIAARQGALHEAPLYVDDSPNMTMTEIRAKCRRLRQRNELRLVIVDYMQLMTSGKRVESRQQEVSEFSRSLKLLAKELEVPVIAISQLNRGPEARTDKKPMLSDLRESGSLEQDADMVVLIHREDAHDRDSPRVGEADLIVAKHRNGPTDTVTVAFQGHYSRFVDMARE